MKMKSKTILTLAALLIFGSVAFGQKVIVDVDKAVNFAGFKSFAWAPGNVAPKPTTNESIITAIENELTTRGLVKDEANPDFRIVVLAAADIDLRGIGPTWNNEAYRSWGGYGNPAALVTVTKGTLLIDLVEVTKDMSVWRRRRQRHFHHPPNRQRRKRCQTNERGRQ